MCLYLTNSAYSGPKPCFAAVLQEMQAGDVAYHTSVEQASKSNDKTPLGQRYERLFEKASKHEVVSGLEAAQSHVRWDALR